MPRPDRQDHPSGPAAAEGTSRRAFLGYVLAAPTVVAAARLGFDVLRAPAASAVPVPSGPQPYDLYDASDLARDACRPTNHLITVTVGEDGSAHFDMPRVEVGQGITTAFAMLIAEELDLPVAKVRVTLADARPELLFNQATGGSTSIYTLHEPVRIAAAVARERLATAAARRWGVPRADVRTSDGEVVGPDGRRAGYGELAVAAAASRAEAVLVSLKSPSEFRVVGRPQARTDARDAVTGRKQFAMDRQVPDALPTMVCRPPTFQGTVLGVENLDAVRTMSGVTHVAPIGSGVAVRARTFGQCIDAVRALQVRWGAGTVDGFTNDKVGERLRAASPPLLPAIPGAEVLDETFTFHFRSGSALEPNSAIADVREGSAEIWSRLGTPILLQQQVAERLALPVEKVTVHVVEGGGSFGRTLFADAALEAVEASKTFGKPVKLMWHRADDCRHGRMHPMAISRVRVQLAANSVIAYDQRHTSVATDFTHVAGEIYSHRAGSQKPLANQMVVSGVFQTTTAAPYHYGAVSQQYNEIFQYDDFPTGSVRNTLAPDVATARELITDRIAERLGRDPVELRRELVKDRRLRAVLERCAEVGQWGRPMPEGTAQGIALHSEYKGHVATLVEIDCRPATVGRRIRDAFTGPRVTRIVTVVDVGRVINPTGLEAQMLGGAMDGVAQALTASLHIEDGLPLEASWDNYWYTRQWNAPLDFRCVIMPTTTGVPGGAGELNCGVTQAAVACAYAWATGTMPTEFPVNFRQPLAFEPKPRKPPVPQSPIDGLSPLR